MPGVVLDQREGGEVAALRALFAHAAIGMALVDLEGRLLLCNPALERLLGYSARELRGIPFTEFTHPDDAALNWELFRELVTGRREQYATTKRYLRQDGSIVWAQLTASAVCGPGGRLTCVVGMVQDITEQVRQAERREALLRVARRFATEPDAGALLAALLDEAAALLQADGGIVTRWDEREQLLRTVHSTVPGYEQPDPVTPGTGVFGRVVQTRRPVVVDDYQASRGVPAATRAGVRAAVGVPLLYESRLLGVFGVVSLDPARRFSPEDLSTLELLAGQAAAVLVGLERARLEGVLLAARTAQHELNNRLALTVGYAELLSRHPRLAPDLAPLADEALRGARAAAEMVNRLQEITRLETTAYGTLDVSRSTA